ncbi:MAG: DUF5067 domain-containing protein [Eubacteriales bacterium]|nr:DUF5067 domain-containing protein [Eubacteriales bacterium]
MDTQNQEQQNQQSKQALPKKKKKKRWGWMILLLAVIVGAAGAAAYYFTERQKPATAVEDFLENVQQMDFNGMSALLQSNDLTALDNADIRTAAYTGFFQKINQKMTFEIKKNQFNIQNGTANVTAHIKYIDGSDIYKETISEFLRQVVSNAFSGRELEEEEIQTLLAGILEEKAASMEDKYSETDITYPVIEANGQWKIVSLDEETVKIMSANFKNVEDEINNTIASMDETSDTGETQTPEATADDKIDMSSEKFTIRYTQHKVADDFGGSPCLLVYYDYTNNGTAASSAMVDVNLQAYQNGEVLSAAIPESNDDAIDQFMAEIQPGATVNVCQAFSLKDMSDVTLQAGEAFSFGGGDTTSQVLKLQ